MEEIKKRPVIALTPIESSQLEAIGHDPATNTLAIQFKGRGDAPGSIYHYQNFTAHNYAEFLAAESKGSHFKKTIKPDVEGFPFEKVS